MPRSRFVTAMPGGPAIVTRHRASGGGGGGGGGARPVDDGFAYPAGRIVHHDFSALSAFGIADGAELTTIPDIIGGLDLTITGENTSTPPVYRAAHYNGLGVMELDRVAKRGIRATQEATATIFHRAAFTIFCIRSWREIYDVRTAGLFTLGGNLPRFTMDWWDGAGVQEWMRGYDRQHYRVNNFGTLTVDKYDLIGYRKTNDAGGSILFNYFQNGVNPTWSPNSDGDDLNPDCFGFGTFSCFGTPASFPNSPGVQVGNMGSAHVGEFIVYDSAMSDANFNAVRNHLLTKWAVET